MKQKFMLRILDLHNQEQWKQMEAEKEWPRREVRLTADKETVARSHAWFQAVKVQHQPTHANVASEPVIADEKLYKS